MTDWKMLTNVAQNTLDGVITDWQENPYRWNQEIDLHIAFASRLSLAFHKLGCGYVEGNYSEGKELGFPHQMWDRVASQYTVDLGDNLGKVKPDVVVWEDIPYPDHPPEAWPIAWACEVKYGDSPSGLSLARDLEKLELLVKRQLAKSGCAIEFIFGRSDQTAPSGVLEKWPNRTKGTSLRALSVYLRKL